MVPRLTLGSLRHWRRWDRDLPIWYDVEYRLPLTAFGKRTGLEPRRADLVVWYLLEWKWIARANLRTPARARYEELARVHSEEYLESLSEREPLARVFGVDPWDVPVDEVMRTVRLGCGGTIAATRDALARRGPTVNLMGGFHHAGPSHGAGLCAVNDIAVAAAVARHEGFEGRIVVLDLDAHPPDGTASCMRRDASTWIGSLSGSSSGSIPGVDETVLPPRCRDREYLAALDALLTRMPEPDLAFVIAGGDVLDDDHLGHLGLTLTGARTRDLRVASALSGVPSVWLPGGGYHGEAWKVLAGTVLALLRHTHKAIQPGDNPMAARFARLARHLDAMGRTLAPPPELSFDDVAEEIGMTPRKGPRVLMGRYTAEALEYAAYRFGLLGFLERRGYGQFRIELGTATTGGERVSLYGSADGAEHLLIDVVVERRPVDGIDTLYVHWLTLRDPRARFSPRRPKMPGQEVPGLGLARELTQLFVLAATRLGVEGIAFAPAHYHTAYVVRSQFRFVDPGQQGRFEAMMRDLGDLSLAEMAEAIESGRVLLNEAPFRWEPGEMILRLGRPADDAAEVAAVRGQARFTLAESVSAALKSE